MSRFTPFTPASFAIIATVIFSATDMISDAANGKPIGSSAVLLMTTLAELAQKNALTALSITTTLYASFVYAGYKAGVSLFNKCSKRSDASSTEERASLTGRLVNV